MERVTLRDVHDRYISKTPAQFVVVNHTLHLCNLTRAVQRAMQLETFKTYANTRVLKHLYDQKPAEEYEFIISNLHTMVKYPDRIYWNKPSKRGEYCFVKRLKNDLYLCSLESVESDELESEAIFVVTAFRVRKGSYLDSYELIWSWRDGDPSS